VSLRERLAGAGLSLAVIMPLSVPSCGPDPSDLPMRVEFHIVGDYRFSWREQRTVTRLAEQAAAEARGLWPGLPAHLFLKVRAGGNVIPETGDVSNAIGPNVIWWNVDPRHAGGVPRHGLKETLVGEGMAIAFERDFAHASRPWGGGEADTGRVRDVLAMSADEWGAWLSADRRKRRRPTM